MLHSMEHNVMTSTQIAEQLGVSQRYIIHLAEKNLIKCDVVGDSYASTRYFSRYSVFEILIADQLRLLGFTVRKIAIILPALHGFLDEVNSLTRDDSKMRKILHNYQLFLNIVDLKYLSFSLIGSPKIESIENYVFNMESGNLEDNESCDFITRVTIDLSKLWNRV